MSIPELKSVTLQIIEKPAKIAGLGVVAIILAGVSLALQGTSMIVGATKAKRMREAMEKQIEAINDLKNYATIAINAYNTKLQTIVEKLPSLSGRGQIDYTDFAGITNDGYAEADFYFMGGIWGAFEYINSLYDTLPEYDREFLKEKIHNNVKPNRNWSGLSEKFRVYWEYVADLKQRLNRYGLNLDQGKNGYLFLIKEIPTEYEIWAWNEFTTDWFTPQKNGKIRRTYTNDNSDTRRRIARQNARDLFESQIDWFFESGLMSWILKGFYTNEDSGELGRKIADDDYGFLYEQAETLKNTINEQNRVTRAAENVTGSPEGTPEIKVSNDLPKPGIFDSVKKLFADMDKKEKTILGGSLLAGGLLLFWRN